MWEWNELLERFVVEKTISDLMRRERLCLKLE
jgi:hypothetical protein